MSFEKHGKVVEGETPAIDVPGQKCAGVNADGEPVVVVAPKNKLRGKSANDVIIDETIEFPED